MKIPLVGQDYTSRSLAVSAQDCINVFPALIDDPNEASTLATATAAAHGKNKGVLYGCPGKHLMKTAAANVKATWSGGGRLFIVISTGFLVELDSTFAVVSSNAFPAWFDDGLPAQIFSNGNQLLIVTGGLAFCDNGAGPVMCSTDNYAGVVSTLGFGGSPLLIWESGDKFLTDGSWIGTTITLTGAIGGPFTIASVTDDEHLLLTGPAPIAGPYGYTHVGIPLTAVSGAVMNNTFFVQRPAVNGLLGVYDTGRQVNFSAVLDGTSWSGLDFFSKEGYPDYLRAITTDNAQLYLWGTETFEVWQADPNAVVGGNPFVQLIGAGGRYGSASTFANISLDGHVFFLGNDDRGGTVAYVLSGFTPVRVSNHAQEALWNLYGMGPNAISYAYQEEGHSFWCINFGVQCWCYEPETGAWHQRFKWTGAAFAPYQTNLHTFIPEWGVGGTHITAWTAGTGVFSSSVNFYDDAGTDICWQRALPYIYNDGKWQYFGRLDLEMETGAAPGGLPAITMDYSDNRGQTFKNPRVANVAAPIDAYSTRVYWLRGGKSRGRIVRFTGAGQTRVALIDANWDITLGTV